MPPIGYQSNAPSPASFMFIFVLFKHLYNFYNVCEKLCGNGIRTHDLSNMSLLPLPLVQFCHSFQTLNLSTSFIVRVVTMLWPNSIKRCPNWAVFCHDDKVWEFWLFLTVMNWILCPPVKACARLGRYYALILFNTAGTDITIKNTTSTFATHVPTLLQWKNDD